MKSCSNEIQREVEWHVKYLRSKKNEFPSSDSDFTAKVICSRYGKGKKTNPLCPLNTETTSVMQLHDSRLLLLNRQRGERYNGRVTSTYNSSSDEQA